MAVWRNGSASDSRSEGWEFESLCAHIFLSVRRVRRLRCGLLHCINFGILNTARSAILYALLPAGIAGSCNARSCSIGVDKFVAQLNTTEFRKEDVCMDWLGL